jgi:exodeoxyribonuclease VII large subunit
VSERTYGVGELVREVNAALQGFGEVWVRGELSGVKVASSGHRYFQIKDAEGQLSCAMWAKRADRLRFELVDGQAVLVRGRLEVYAQRGSLSLIVEELQPEGVGELQLAFEQLKAKLEAEGLFAAERKRPLPSLPQRLGLVTSPSGAAVRDVLKVLSRWEHLAVLLAPVRVQGKGAEGEIARAVAYLGRSGLVDVVLVVRGGGSLEDLWAFNEEVVARAIAACGVPVVSGVGHEVDFTIADFVADIRASTPTAAAEMVVDTEAAFSERIANLSRRAYQSAKFAIEERKSEVVTLAQHRIFQNFKVRLMNLAQDVDGLEARAWEVVRGEQRKIAETKARARLAEERIAAGFRAILRDKQAAWETRAAALHGLSPLDTLKKGYALCWSGDGRRAVTGIGGVREADEMLVSFYRGEFRCRVEAVDREKAIESHVEKKG